MTGSSTLAPPYHLFQFRLRTLLIFTTCMALICVALKFPNDHWVALTRGLMLISLLSAVLLVIYRTHQIRAAALGYSIFCAGCMVYIYVHVYAWNPYAWTSGSSESIPIILFCALHGDYLLPASSPIASMPIQNEDLPRFLQIFYHVLATFVGLLGSLIAQYLYVTQQREPSPGENPRPTS